LIDFRLQFRIIIAQCNYWPFLESLMPTEEEPIQPGNTPAPATGIHTDTVAEFKCEGCGGLINAQGIAPFSNVACPACGANATVPARLANFLLLRLLGTGGMGGVYYARDEVLGRFVAIKVMLQSLGDDPAFIETFQREAQAVAKLNHPNIAQIYSFGREKGQPYIVMELVSGDRVDAMMESAERLTPALVLRIGLEIAQGLSAADDVGLVHGDIKPENILLDTKGQAKLVDFGLATVAHQAAGEGIWGTPYYIAPEKIRRQKVDARSDIYSLGATLYHMLTGKPPFEGETPVEVVKARLENPPPDPRDLMPELPEIISAIIKRMLAVDRAERYPNYLSLISDLRKAAQELGKSASSTTGYIGGGSKKIRFKKKKGGAGLDEPSIATLPSAPEPKGKKLVFHKDKASPSPFKTNAPAPQDAVTAEAEEAIPPPTPEEIQARKARTRKRVRRIIFTLVFLGMVAVAAAIGHAVYVFRSAEIARRAELFALHQARTDAATLYLSISNQVNRTVLFAQQGKPMEEEIQQAVEQITGSRLVMAPEPTPEPEPAATPEAAPDASTNAVPAAADGATTETAVQADGAAAGEGPADQASAEEGASDEEIPPPESDGIAEAPAEAPPPAEPEVPAHPVVNPARQALELLAKLAAMSQQANDDLQAAVELEENVRKSTRSSDSKRDVQELQTLGKQTQDAAAAARTTLDTAVSRTGQVREILIRFQRQKEAREAAEREVQRRRDEAERLERERQVYQAKAAAEVQQAQNEGIETKAAFFSANNFEEALAALKQKQDNFTTKEGKEALRVVTERYTWMVMMKQALIAGMQAAPYAWGWGFGAAARDIEKATDRGIFVKGTTRPYPWSEVQPTQMLKLVDYYVGVRTMKPRDRVNLIFGAAIYCDEFGPSGRERAQSYANRAMDIGISRETFTRLLESGWH